MAKRLDQAEAEKIIAGKLAGKTGKDIAEELGRPMATVLAFVKKCVAEGIVFPVKEKKAKATKRLDFVALRAFAGVPAATIVESVVVDEPADAPALVPTGRPKFEK